jgi:steroid 5-alpha reductase family enzyme
MIQKFRENKGASILVSIISYVVALVVAIAVARIFMPAHPLRVIAIGDLAATVTIFIISVIMNNSSMYDPYWSVKPAVIAGYYLAAFPGAGPRGILVSALVLLYSLRLTTNFYRDWPGLVKEDFRYVSFRNQFPSFYWPVSFLAVHLFPTVMVWLGCLPLYAVFSSGEVPLNGFDLAGGIVLAGAVTLAFVADGQLRRFKETQANKGKTIDVGLWRLSRHPNYLGEISTWWGLLLFGLACGWQWWWTAIGAVVITAMFVFASIPLMEKRLLQSRPDYLDYRSRTPMLLPAPGKRH